MATALIISQKDIKRFTAMNGSIDSDLFLQYILIAQEIHIQNYLGSNLLEKIQDDIIAGTLTGNYLNLVTKFVKPMLIHYAMAEYLSFAGYTISNKGVYKHSSENAETASNQDIKELISAETRIAEHYTQRFIDFMCTNSSDYPEYNSNTSEDMNSSTDLNLSNWYI